MPDILSALLGESQPALKALDFSIFCGIPGYGGVEPASGDRVLVAPGLEWERLDTALTDKSRFPKLGAVRIHYKIYDIRKREMLSSTGYTPVSHVLRQQTLAVLPKVKEGGFIVAIGEQEKQLEFNRVVDPLLDGAWSRTERSWVRSNSLLG